MEQLRERIERDGYAVDPQQGRRRHRRRRLLGRVAPRAIECS